MYLQIHTGTQQKIVKKEAMTLKKSGEGYMEGFGEQKGEKYCN